VLDTTVLAYAAGGQHPLREPCDRILERVATGALRATTTVEVIQEFAHVHGRRRKRALAARLARDYAQLLAPLVVVERADLERGLELWAETPALGAFDAVLAAAARGRGAEALVSADAAFAAVADLRHVDPAGPELDELLRA
jgi:predicted nucleic acid-binding protein